MPPAGFPRARYALTAPLLLGLLVGCGGEGKPAPWERLARDFPTHTPHILDGRGSLDATSAGWATSASSWQPSAGVTLPARAQDGFVIDGITVVEKGVVGEGHRVEEAIVYPRAEGHAFWHATATGAEEWLLLPDGVDDGDRPVASWSVTGGELVQAGVAARVDRVGQAPIWVHADRAYGPGERPLAVRLAVEGDELSLYVEASEGPVLVDPSWGSQGTLGTARKALTLTELLNGQILATGGEQGGVFASSELYDPMTGLWSAGPGMGQGRSYHRATRLTNGDVLVTGGWNGSFPLFSAVLYLSASNSFTLRPPMDFERAAHTSTPLLDGRVLVCGGAGSGGGGEASADGPWPTALTEGPTPTSSLLPFGGSGGFGGNDDCEVYDPSIGGGTWTEQEFMNDWRLGHIASRLNDGRVVISGGEDFGFVMSSAELFIPATNSLFSTGFMTTARSAHAASTLADGRVLVTGGYNNGGTSLSSTEFYNPATGTWSAGPPMGTARAQHTSSLLGDGRVLVVGGIQGSTALSSAEIFDPVGNSWSVADPIPGARNDHAAEALSDGSVMAAGGASGPTSNNTSYIFSVAGTLGTPCTMDSTCLSGFCVDGVCCDNACANTCEACTATLKGSGNDGTCGSIAAGTDPELECSVATCMGDDLDPADTCDGSGSCADPGIIDCGAYTCTMAICLTSCTTSTECAVDAYCDTGGMMCVPKKNNGEPATDPEECVSGFVADGVCCSSACDLGVCDACTAALGASADGTCTDVIGDCDDGNECTVSACDPAMGCLTSSKLDGSLCEAGVCIAGSCVPDAAPPTTSGSTVSSSASGGTDGAGGEGDPTFYGDPVLEGAGICTVSTPGHAPSRGGWWLLAAASLGLAGARRRRD